jgi:hypothetical protein
MALDQHGAFANWHRKHSLQQQLQSVIPWRSGKSKAIPRSGTMIGYSQDKRGKEASPKQGPQSSLQRICRRPRSHRPFSISASRTPIKFSRRSSLGKIDQNSERPRPRRRIRRSALPEKYSFTKESRNSRSKAAIRWMTAKSILSINAASSSSALDAPLRLALSRASDPLAFVVCGTVTKIECGVRGWRARRGAACELLCCTCPWLVMLALPPVVGRGDRGRAGRSTLACWSSDEKPSPWQCGANER